MKSLTTFGSRKDHKRLMKQFHTGWGKRTMLVEFGTLVMVVGLLVNNSIRFECKFL